MTDKCQYVYRSNWYSLKVLLKIIIDYEFLTSVMTIVIILNYQFYLMLEKKVIYKVYIAKDSFWRYTLKRVSYEVSSTCDFIVVLSVIFLIICHFKLF